jgi:hypothetical protein
MDMVTIPNVIQTQYGFEDVSDLNGIALPAMFYDTLGEEDGTTRRFPGILYDLIEEAIVDMREDQHQYLKTIVKDMPRSCESIADYLYLSNVYVSIQERLYFKLKQIRRSDYKWLKADVVATCQTLLKKVMKDDCTPDKMGEIWTEELIMSPSMEKRACPIGRRTL